jgi:hypothetical protein
MPVDIEGQRRHFPLPFDPCSSLSRVKCDLKDLSVDVDPNVEISCTNCRERGIRCKDDYAESKKQLRRGKRINQLELECVMQGKLRHIVDHDLQR